MLLPDEIRENRDVFRTFFAFAQWAFLFILLLFLYISQSISVSDSLYNLKRMEREIAELEKENVKLETEISFLSSPERIGRIAEKELKLGLVKQEDIIWIDDGVLKNSGQAQSLSGGGKEKDSVMKN